MKQAIVRILIAALLSVCGITATYAESGEPVLVVKLRSGEEQRYMLKELPQVTFSDEGNTLSVSINEAKTTVEVNDVEHFRFDMQTNYVQTAEKDKFSIRFINANMIRVNKPGADVSAWSIDGCPLTSKVTHEAAFTDIEIGSDQRIVILKIDNQSIKLVR